MQNNIYIYIAIMVIVTTLIRKEIKNVTLRSFLYYIPYVTLAVMTFPAILSATGSPISAWVALAVAVIAAWMGKSLFLVSSAACIVVFVLELLLHV